MNGNLKLNKQCLYEGESNEKLKYFFIWWFIEHIWYTVTLFFYIDSIAFHLHLLIGSERLASHHLFAWSKDVKIAWGEVWRLWRMWKTLEGQILDCSDSSTGSMGPSIVMLQQNTCTQTSCLLVLIAGRRWFLRRSAYVALVTVFPLGM